MTLFEGGFSLLDGTIDYLPMEKPQSVRPQDEPVRERSIGLFWAEIMGAWFVVGLLFLILVLAF